MSDAPERIWATPEDGYCTETDIGGDKRHALGFVEYVRADLTPQWQPIDDDTPTDVPHIRGLWVHRAKTGECLYWQADCGIVEAGEFMGSDGCDFGWTPEDYTHWMPLPEPPK